MPKSKQTRLTHRAPHGAPEFTARLAAYCTEAQKAKFDSHGGSVWLRRVIDETSILPAQAGQANPQPPKERI